VSETVSTIRVFIDSNVLVEGLFAPWSLSRAILILSRSGVFRIILSPYVEIEVERALLKRLAANPEEGSRLIDEYDRALQLLSPERIAKVTRDEIVANRSLIKHGNDVPVLSTAINAKPDYLITANTEHFNETVAQRTGLRIVTPQEFLSEFKNEV
jgi:predicted nucleic acid-binding protein